VMANTRGLIPVNIAPDMRGSALAHTLSSTMLARW